jgi:hypothetical protein
LSAFAAIRDIPPLDRRPRAAALCEEMQSCYEND